MGGYTRYYIPKKTKTLKYLSKGHHNITYNFITYFQSWIHDNDTNGVDWAQVTNDDFNGFCMIYHGDFIRLSKDELENTMKLQQTHPWNNTIQLRALKDTSSVNLKCFLYLKHRRELPVLHYHKITVIYPHPFW